MKYLFGLACVLACVALIGSASAGNFYPALLDDTYVSTEEGEEVFGSKDELWVVSEDDEPAMITYLYFMKVGSKSADEIDSATLSLYVTEVEEPGIVGIYFSEGGFSESNANWLEDELEYDDEADDTEDIDEDGWYDFDATELVKKAIDRCPSCPFSIVIVSEGDASVAFSSKEGSDDNKAVLKFTTVE